MKSFVTLSDLHFPYEDPEALFLVIQFLKDFRPDQLYLNGDIWDMPQISKYQKRRTELDDTRSLQEHLDYGNEKVGLIIDAAGAKENKVILGNHEDRWEAYLGSAAKDLHSLRCLEFDELFNLKHVDWCQYGKGFWVNENLFIYHGSFTSTNWTDRERLSVGASTITGHMHRQRVTYHRDRTRTFKSIGQGCLCQLNPPYSRIPPDWQQGFVYGYVLDDHKFRAIETEIIDGEDGKWMLPEGHLYQSKLASPGPKGRRKSSVRPVRKMKSAKSADTSTRPPRLSQQDLEEFSSRLSPFLAALEEKQ